MHPYEQYRSNKVERSRVGKIVGNGGSAMPAEMKSALSRGRDAALNPEGSASTKLKFSGSSAKSRLDKPHRAKGGRVKAPVTVNVMVAPKDDKPMPGLGALPPIPAPGPAIPPPSPMAGPGMPPPPMMRAKGGRVTPAKAESLKFGTKVQHTLGGKTTKPSDFTDWPPITKKRGGRVLHMTAGAASGEGREDQADFYAGRSKRG